MCRKQHYSDLYLPPMTINLCVELKPTLRSELDYKILKRSKDSQLRFSRGQLDSTILLLDPNACTLHGPWGCGDTNNDDKTTR
uniref:Uncharacterized protein n=1 Tax=Romanomermis culicivorax TaxID=13658 RepID=A0A915J614_ROMCU